MYEPFIIADNAIGVYGSKKPWISPADAFRKVENARIFRGRVIKRLGWQHFTTLGTKVVNESLGATVGGESFIGYNPAPSENAVLFPEISNLAVIGHLPVLPPFPSPAVYSITFNVNGRIVRCLNTTPPFQAYPSWFDLTQIGGPPLGGSFIGFVNLSNGRWVMTEDPGFPIGAGPVTVSYEYNRGLPVTGIKEFVDAAGVQQLVATDTRRFWVWDATNTRMVDLVGSDTFTGDGKQLMQITADRDTLVLNNSKDKSYLYDPIGGLRQQNTDLTTPGGTNKDIARCWQTLAFKNRLIIFRPTEGGTDLVRTLRWARVNQLQTFDGQDSTEIPTDARFMQARLIGDRCIIFCDRPGETFELVPEDDALAPWSFRRLRGEGDAASRMGGANLLDEALVWGQTRLLRCDGTEALRVYQDEQPDVVSGANVLLPQNSVGIDADILEEVWIAFTASNKEWPDHIVAVNARTRAIMFYTHDVSAFGRYHQPAGTVYTWANAPGTWAQANFTWDTGALRAGFPLLLVGDRASRIFDATAPQYGDDVMNAIDVPTVVGYEMLVETQALNPYAIPGGTAWNHARLGMIDLVAEAVDGGVVTVEVESAFSADPILTQTISLTPAKAGDKNVVRRVFVNRSAEGHIIRLRENSSKSFAIEAIVPHFSPTAPIRKVA